MDQYSDDDGFAGERVRLHRIAHRLLGSASDADDVVQETWLRLQRSDRATIDNLAGWLTTVVTRLSLNLLRSRSTRTHDDIDSHLSDLVVVTVDTDPAEQVLLSEAVGLAMTSVLDSLSPVERVVFVLHDVFAVPFGQIAPIVERTAPAVRQAASRARRRLRGAQDPAADLASQRAVVDAFFDAARSGDLDRLIAVLHPDAVLRVDTGATAEVHKVLGAAVIAERAASFADPARQVAAVTVNGAPGVLVTIGSRRVALMWFTVRDDLVVAIDSLVDPTRLATLDVHRHQHDR